MKYVKKWKSMLLQKKNQLNNYLHLISLSGFKERRLNAGPTHLHITKSGLLCQKLEHLWCRDSACLTVLLPLTLFYIQKWHFYHLSTGRRKESTVENNVTQIVPEEEHQTEPHSAFYSSQLQFMWTRKHILITPKNLSSDRQIKKEFCYLIMQMLRIMGIRCRCFSCLSSNAFFKHESPLFPRRTFSVSFSARTDTCGCVKRSAGHQFADFQVNEEPRRPPRQANGCRWAACLRPNR